jgi:hypothetical protein
VVNSIAATRTRAGLRVAAELDTGSYPAGTSISREQLGALPIRPHAQRGTWNYTIEPASAPEATRLGHGGHELARSQALAVLADSRLTGMTAGELGALARRLAPLQAAQAEQRKYHQRGGPRRQAKADHCRPLLSDAGRVLITVIYPRQACSQKALAELLGINPTSIGQAIAETRKLHRHPSRPLLPRRSRPARIRHGNRTQIAALNLYGFIAPEMSFRRSRPGCRPRSKTPTGRSSTPRA